MSDSLISRKRRSSIDGSQVVKQVISSVTNCFDSEETPCERVCFIPTGSILLNLALSQKGLDGGWARGRIINIVGDGSSGKTLLALEAMAQFYYRIKSIKSSVYPDVQSLSLVYNNVEGVMDMPVEAMYGQRFYDSVEWIPEGNEKRESPMTCEALGRDLFGRIDRLASGQALIYVEDSVDALTSEAGIERMNKSVKSGKALDGTYGTEKAKYFSSEFFNNLCSRMAGKDVTIFLISQVREKIDKVAFGEKHYRTGGKALDFYTHQVIWLAQTGKLTNEHRGEKRVYGVHIRGRVKRNKTAVPFREADFNILFNYGIDDLLSCAEYLTPEEINAIHGGKRMSREDFVAACEVDDNLRDLLWQAVEHKWHDIEIKTAVRRKARWENL